MWAQFDSPKVTNFKKRSSCGGITLMKERAYGYWGQRVPWWDDGVLHAGSAFFV